MKVIFLDIDGVLNSNKFYDERSCDLFIAEHELTSCIDVDAVDCLNSIIEATNSIIILSSSWRNLAPINSINRALRYHGIAKPIIGVTPPYGSPRGKQISQWLDMVDVDGFVILDDDSGMGHLSEHLVQTSYKTGLLEEHVQPAIEILNKRKEK